MHPDSSGWLPKLLPLVILGIVMFVRLKRAGQERPLNLTTLWILPVVYALLCAVMLVLQPPRPVGWLLFGVALLFGGMLGWQRGRMMHIRVDPLTGKVWQKSSAAAVIFLLAIIVLRRVATSAFPADPHAGGAALVIFDVMLGFALGLIGMTRIEMGLRARRLLGESARPV